MRTFQSTGLTPAAATRTSTSVGAGSGCGQVDELEHLRPTERLLRDRAHALSLAIVVYTGLRQVTPTYTRPLEELRRSDATEFGGKSASLGELLSAGLRVPSGFAISAKAFAKFIEETGLAGTIAAALARVSPGNVDTIDAASKTIGEAMRFAPLPDDLRAELVARYDELAAATGEVRPPVAVRSSALGEDSEEASHAGQQESFLWVCGAGAGLRRRARLLGRASTRRTPSATGPHCAEMRRRRWASPSS